MPRLRLTELVIDRIKPTGKQVTYWDTTVPGFNVRCSQSGTKTYTVVSGDNRRRTSLARFGEISLVEARREAMRVLSAKRHQKRPTRLPQLVAAFLEDCETRLKPSSVQRYRDVLAKAPDNPLDQVAKAIAKTAHELLRERGMKPRRNLNSYLKRLYDARLLMKPWQQRYTEQPDANFHIYALTKKGEQELTKRGRLADAVKHSGSFPHQLMGATFTATIDIMCRRDGHRFIPAHEYLGEKSKKITVPFMWELNGKDRLITGNPATFDPDYVFGIRYKTGTTLYFVAEFNRDTEPCTFKTPYRRSDLKTIRQVEAFMDGKVYEEEWGKRTMPRYIFVTVSDHKAAAFIERAKQEAVKVPYLVTAVMPTFQSPFRPPQFPSYLYEEPCRGAVKEFMFKKTA